MYEHVLSLVKKCADIICIKAMLPLKTLRQLLDTTKLSTENLFKLKTDCITQIERLECQHLGLTNKSLQTIREKQMNLENRIARYENAACGESIRWWTDFSYFINQEESIVEEVNQQLKKYAVRVTSLADVGKILNSWMNMVTRERSNLKNVFKEHKFFCTNIKLPILLSETLHEFDDHKDNYHLDEPFRNNFKNHHSRCILCHKYKIEQVLRTYKCLIYNNGSERTYQERMLKAILSFVTDERTIQNANCNFEIISLLRKELKEYESYLDKISDGIHLSNNLRLRTPELNDIETKTESELQILMHKLQFAKEAADKNFHRHFQILKYVKTLEKDIQSHEVCPICLELPNLTECVLQCGHKMCCDCFVQVKKNHPIRYTCHAYRNVQQTENTYLVYTQFDVEPSFYGTVVGDYSQKVKQIVQTTLSLRETDPDVKIVIFSHWDDILNLIAEALSTNGIQNRTKSVKFHNCIDEFKSKDLNVTCLLLPLACGSKGLNLTEATHIFFVEPILNPAEECQAIGRIHRIGQTRETFVHRFIVKNTIEETIFDTISKDIPGKWKTTNVTVENLKILFTQHRQIN